MDAVLVDAARSSGLSIEEIQEYVPKCLTVWMDPGEVSYRIGENTPVNILYCTRPNATGRGGMGEGGEEQLTPDYTDWEVTYYFLGKSAIFETVVFLHEQ